jgi:hypothetical protein
MDLSKVVIPPNAHLDRTNDCAIWAIAAFTSTPYEDVLIETAREDSVAGKNGLHISQIKRICETLGYPVKLKKSNLDMDTLTGILSCWLLDGKLKEGHVALLKRGQVIDSIGGITVWDWQDYCNPHRCLVHGVLIPTS